MTRGPFRWRMRVRFGHEDHAQVVYFPRYLDFFHQCFEELFLERAKGYRHCLETDGVGWPAVRVETDFARPLRFDDLFEIEMSLVRIGTKSATFRYRGFRIEDGVELPVADAQITVVCIGMLGDDHFQPRPIPDSYRELFSSLEPA